MPPLSWLYYALWRVLYRAKWRIRLQHKKRLRYNERAFWNGLVVRQKHNARCSWTRKKATLTRSTGPSGRDARERKGRSRESTHYRSGSLSTVGKILCWMMGFKTMMNIRRGSGKAVELPEEEVKWWPLLLKFECLLPQPKVSGMPPSSPPPGS